MARPALGEGALAATITGQVVVADRTPGEGTVHLSVTGVGGESGATVEVDVAHTRPELDRGPDGELLLRGSVTRPAAELGRPGPPLLNPTVVLRWRAVLVPDA